MKNDKRNILNLTFTFRKGKTFDKFTKKREKFFYLPEEEYINQNHPKAHLTLNTAKVHIQN
jgi:hypothetical protein